MTRTITAAFAIALLFSGTLPASAWWDCIHGVCGAKGNDTGGIIPWQPGPYTMALAREYAQAQCASWGKVARITSVRRVPGDYIAYQCRFDRRPDYGWYGWR